MTEDHELRPATADQPASREPSTSAFALLAEAAQDRKQVAGSTHTFYRYPARFSPQFAAVAIGQFSRPGDIVADLYMGGGTAIVEGISAGREMIGNDLNSLAAFITKVKITRLDPAQIAEIRLWLANDVPNLSYRLPVEPLAEFFDTAKTKNLTLVRARFIKKAVAGALASISRLSTIDARDFAKCALLRVGQWALDGREAHTSLDEFRQKLATTTTEMLEAITTFSERVRESGGSATLLNLDTSVVDQASIFREEKKRVSLVVTSPPYPGVHVLYHRWQVDGRRETPAPYWITGCNDGQGASFYNFGDRRQAASDNYFRSSLRTLQAIRRVMKDGGHMVQMVAFNRAHEQLERYLENMQIAGFSEVSIAGDERVWRQVPNRKWHARLKGNTSSSNEVVLVHRAV